MLRKYDMNIWKHIEVAYDRAQLLTFVLAVLKLRVLLVGTEKDRYRLILYLVQQGQKTSDVPNKRQLAANSAM
jgi:hypothetical protein